MASRTLPGIGLNGFWSLGEDGYKDQMDTNLLNLSALVQGRALDLVSTTPGSPTNGQVYLFSETHPTDANKVAIRDNGAWVYLTPLTGWKFYDVAAGYDRRFNGTAWIEVVAGSGGAVSIAVATKTGSYTLVLGDANDYRLIDSTSGAAVVTVPPEASVAFPVGTRIYIEQDHTNTVTISPGAGVTLESRGSVFGIAGDHGVAVLFKKGTNLWTLTGDLA